MKKKNAVMGIMLVMIMVMAVGYAAFSTSLVINGTSSIVSTWKVVFTNIEELSKTEGVTVSEQPTATNTTATFNVDLESPGDYIEYRITVSNQGTLNAIIEDIKASETGSDAIKFEITNIKIGDTLAKGTSTTFNIKISYDENITSQPSVITNTLTVEINYAQNIGQSITPGDPVIDNSNILLVDKILQDNNEQSDANLDFSKTSEEDGTKGLYYTSTNTEGNKTTYYFRGAVGNNYVKFGKTSGCGYKGNSILHVTDLSNSKITETPTESQCKSTPVCDAGTVVKDNYGLDYRYVTGLDAATCAYLGGTQLTEYATYGEDAIALYWKIIRINEDRSIRLIYQGLSTNASGDDVTIGASAFNTNENDNAYVGYMYGTPGSDNYNDTHANINDSTIKTFIDDWYEANLKTNYSSYLADSGFCNDRSIALTEKTWNVVYDTALGYGTNLTYYGSYNRVANEEQPQFICQNAEHDLFTTSSSSKGNKALDYPIGLITVDEMIYAGGVVGEDNNTYYLKNNTPYWTMSPNIFDSYSSADIYHSIALGNILNSNSADVYTRVRPVINLKSIVEIEEGGKGTATNPYVIKTS